MGVHIDSEEFERLARELADRRGTSVDEALIAVIREELARSREAERVSGRTGTEPRVDEAEIARRRALVREIQDRIAAAPVLDPRPYREILYDEDGLPK